MWRYHLALALWQHAHGRHVWLVGRRTWRRQTGFPLLPIRTGLWQIRQNIENDLQSCGPIMSVRYLRGATHEDETTDRNRLCVPQCGVRTQIVLLASVDYDRSPRGTRV